LTTTYQTRQEAQALLVQAEKALEEGNVESFDSMLADAQTKMAEADRIDQAASQLKVLKGEFNRPVNTVPIADKDAALYNPDDTTAVNKASYRPATWVKGLPAMSQPMWVQEQMGKTEKEHAQFQTDVFIKWMRSPSDDQFWKSATVDETKAMQEDTDAEGGFFVPEQFVNQVVHDPGVQRVAGRLGDQSPRSPDSDIPGVRRAVRGCRHYQRQQYDPVCRNYV
jgi:HK97 family phage major capsid protein